MDDDDVINNNNGNVDSSSLRCDINVNQTQLSSGSPEALVKQETILFQSLSSPYEDLDYIGGFSREDRWRESMRDTGQVSHGFSFGERCASLANLESEDQVGFKEDENEDEDEGISEVYQAEVIDDIPAPSPMFSKRHVISQRIDRVGHVGQNLGLGHRIGILADDSELRPRPVIPQTYCIELDEDSPIQTDLLWIPPRNASKFSNLSYDVEMCHQGENWNFINSCRQPVFRIYQTDEKLFIGKFRFIRKEDDVVILLRVRARGEISEERNRYELTGDWCQCIKIFFCGTMSTRLIEEQVMTTNL